MNVDTPPPSAISTSNHETYGDDYLRQILDEVKTIAMVGAGPLAAEWKYHFHGFGTHLGNVGSNKGYTANSAEREASALNRTLSQILEKNSLERAMIA